MRREDLGSARQSQGEGWWEGEEETGASDAPSSAWRAELGVLPHAGCSVCELGVWLDRAIGASRLPHACFSDLHAAAGRPSLSLWPGATRRLRDVLPIALPSMLSLAGGVSGKHRLRDRCRRERTSWMCLWLHALNYASWAGGSRRPARPAHTTGSGPRRQLVWDCSGKFPIRFLTVSQGDYWRFSDLMRP